MLMPLQKRQVFLLNASCLAAIVLSFRDKSHSPIEAPHNYLSAYVVIPGDLLAGDPIVAQVPETELGWKPMSHCFPECRAISRGHPGAISANPRQPRDGVK